MFMFLDQRAIRKLREPSEHSESTQKHSECDQNVIGEQSEH